ncbi:MAG: exopolyphosphatase [Gammaproteobacteria bacterium]|nr:exopolyphosphatase [Gammaproteobacteria bacterium]
MTADPKQSIAAVDLGSNSFHMIVAEVSGERIQVIDRLKEMVRLAGGLNKQRHLSDKAMGRALECLGRFGQRVRELPQGSVRAVGTNTLRQARNGQKFLTQAQRALGHPIEVVAGREEARLIYLGVSHNIFDDKKQRLVIDIGGGSTELIIGQGFQPQYTESLYIGCVGLSKTLFKEGNITKQGMKKAILVARQELEIIETTYRQIGWDTAVGSSGTILAIAEVLRRQKWSDGTITRDGLDRLRRALVAAGNVDTLDSLGVSRERGSVFPGGFAILMAIFQSFEIDRMSVSTGALREGLLHDLLGRIHEHDVRDATVAELMTRYGVDKGQAQRVDTTAKYCLEQASEKWSLTSAADGKMIDWACRLHEIGLAIAHSQYQKHGAYLIKHLDMPGFSRQDQVQLAALIRDHRRKFATSAYADPPGDVMEKIRYLSVILRLAVLLHRSRATAALPDFSLRPRDSSLHIQFPPKWLQAHPLTEVDLAQERTYLKIGTFELTYR